MSRAAHEAGHALALLFFGCRLYDVALRGGAGYTIGRDPIAGLRPWRRGDPARSRPTVARAEIAVIVALAGAIGEGLPGQAVTAEDAAGLKTALAILPPTERPVAMIRGERRTRALIGSAPGQRFIARLSGRLIRDRRLGDAVCRAVFRDAFGRSPPPLSAWLLSWPPDLAWLTRGELPVADVVRRRAPAGLTRKAA
jgi:hypothetical protein